MNSYSWHVGSRQNQKYELFYNASESPSDPKAIPLGSDWVSLGSVDTSYSIKTAGQVGVSFADGNGGVIARARQLLLKVGDPNCFYGEIDVVSHPNDAHRPGSAVNAAGNQVDRIMMPMVLAGDIHDSAHGNLELVKGVRGHALKFDGFGTKVVRSAGQAEPLGKAFTLEAWIAPQEFSLNQTALINQEKDRTTGYFFGIDDKGCLLFQANIGGKWETCISERRLPILRWSHVAVTFEPDQGIALYIDGTLAGRKPVKGDFVPAKGTDIWIGMSQAKQPPIPQKWSDPDMWDWMVFDGLIDELKIYAKALREEEVRAAFASLKPEDPQPLHYRKMPSGPKDGKRFGAFYTRLNYAPEWEKQWRVGDRADVVVTFKDPRANFVFWRGASYIPHWVTRNEAWYNNQFVERMSNADGCKGCVEPMSDKKCNFSHVRIIHSSPARTVIHWRYAPVGLNLKHPYVDPYSGLGDWVDEYYTIYPDMVGVRSITLYSTAIDQFTDWQESIVVNQPGRLPEDNIKATAVSIGNLQGEVADYSWPETATNGKLTNLPELSCIQILNLKAEMSPFMIVPPSPDVKIHVFGGRAPHSNFHSWNHWPVAQAMSHGTTAHDASKPTSSSLTFWKNWEPYRSTENSKTHLMLHGMTDKDVKDLTGVAKSWLSPPEVRVISGNYRNAGFDREQKAFVLEGLDSHAPGALQLRIDASAQHPLVNPAIVVKNWPGGIKAEVIVDGKPWDARLGVEDELEGSNLVMWLGGIASVEPMYVKIVAAASDR